MTSINVFKFCHCSSFLKMTSLTKLLREEVVLGGLFEVGRSNFLERSKMFLKRALIPELKRSLSTKMSAQQVQHFVRDGKKILGAALNFRDIVRTRGVPVPESPVLFLKPTSSYIQEGQDIVIPKYFTKVAHEVELGVIIGKSCKNVSKNDAMKYVAGYCLALDLTAQCELGVARQKGLPWSIGKGFDTSTPVSRFISLNELKDPNNISLWLKINGQMRQEGNTADLIFGIPELIEYASKYMTLEPNDVILTGTPDGAAPMAPGDVVECGLGDIVTLKFKVRS